MSEDDQDDPEGVALEGEVAVGNVIVGDQSFAYADVQLRVETAAHQRWVEQQRLEHELTEATRVNSARRMRESREDRARQRQEYITFAVFIGTPLAGLVFAAGLSIWTTDEETR